MFVFKIKMDVKVMLTNVSSPIKIKSCEVQQPTKLFSKSGASLLLSGSSTNQRVGGSIPSSSSPPCLRVLGQDTEPQIVFLNWGVNG